MEEADIGLILLKPVNTWENENIKILTSDVCHFMPS